LRLKASIWVGAYVRRLGAIPVSAMITRRGDADAGAIFIKISRLDGSACVLRPALAMLDEPGERQWTHALKDESAEESAADAYLARQAEFDTDLWVIEVEDREGRHFLDEFVKPE
jgi:hypothetical protein